MKIVEMIISHFKGNEERQWRWLAAYSFCVVAALILALLVRSKVIGIDNDNVSGSAAFVITLLFAFAFFSLIRLILDTTTMIVSKKFSKNKNDEKLSNTCETESLDDNIELNEESKKKPFTTAQQVIFFYYLFNEIGINFGNSNKSEWKRLIHIVVGKNEQDIKEKLRFDYEDRKTKRDLRIVAENITELLPKITLKIENDIKE